jgi:hypothetical protein
MDRPRRITVLDGVPDGRYAPFEDAFLQEVARRKDALRVDFYRLRELDIHFCTGCWTCWTRTPGLCAFRDGMDAVLSPVSMGFVSSLTKKACDRMIPIVLPDFLVCGGEFHHKARYPSYPGLGLLLLDPDRDPDTLQTVSDVFRRTALNFKTRLILSETCGVTPGEAIDAVSRL